VATHAEFSGGTHWTGTTLAEAATACAAAINASPLAGPFVEALATGVRVVLTARAPGSSGNSLYLQLRQRSFPLTLPGHSLVSMVRVLSGSTVGPFSSDATHPMGAFLSEVAFSGGVDVPFSGGVGDSVISLTGMTERLPLGALASDADFLGENILGGRATSFQTTTGAIRSVYENLPLTREGLEYTRFLGAPGSLLSMSDGAALVYTPYTASSLSGSRVFRIFRGGGSVFVLSGPAPGGPVSWVSESYSAAQQPVLKGAALAGKALLVRNFPEEAYSTGAPNRVRSEGDELQMVILTHTIYGTPTTTATGLTLAGVLAPTGYGEGYAAADRYLIPGRPLDRGRQRKTPDPALEPAPYSVSNT
jgi:hypothetical protein